MVKREELEKNILLLLKDIIIDKDKIKKMENIMGVKDILLVK